MKYGTHVWVVYEYRTEIQVHDDWIQSFIVEEDSQYYLTRDGSMELTEDEVILYEDKERLYDVICEKMSDIRKKEEEEQ